jgi:hypothetical protein
MGNRTINYWRQSWVSFWGPYQSQTLFDVVALLSVATISFHFGFGPIWQEISFVFLGFAFLYQRVLSYWYFWLGLFILQSVDLYQSWISAANHTWVMWYWGLAMLAACLFKDTTDQTKIISNNARWLLIIIMLVAVVWKITTPSYLDGSFFERNLVSNPLMTTFTHVISGLEWDAIEGNYQTNYQMFDNPNITSRQYQSNNTAHYLSLGITWWVLIIELVIGALLLIQRFKTDTWAHILNIVFIACAYLGAPILGFAWILIVLGIAATGTSHSFLRPWYALLFLLILIYGLPWDFILFTWLGILPLN